MMPVGGPNPTPSTMNYTVVINSAVWLGALAYYYIDARKWFKGPVMTLSEDAMTEEAAERARQEGLNIEVRKEPAVTGEEKA